MSNFNKIAPGIYVCDNQNGFKRAVDDYLDDQYTDSQERKRMCNASYPNKGYPCLVSISLGYRGYTYIHTNFIRIDTLISKVVKTN